MHDARFVNRLHSLRQRRDDIPVLVDHFLKRSAKGGTPKTVTKDAMELLMKYDWPGNVRELENKVQQVIALATTNVILPEQIELPAGSSIARPDGRLKSFKEAKREVVNSFEVGYISKLLAMTGGNISEAARRLGLHRRSLQRKLHKYPPKS